MTTALVYAHLVALQLDRTESRLQEAYLQYWTQLPNLMQQRSMSSVVAWLVQAGVNADHIALPATTLTGTRALTVVPDTTVQAGLPAAVVQATPKADA
ncbi:hypothetical protein [Allobranchiibius sp. GilTou38]|uniref:hypothetical protein n=1 Tax=Allobranchiibius sp. GilTou38 TaxID=2815210 RepID=UPI001AA1AE4E|nr:hypothetical protein [Allobranchiibius sp. GilTou38]MBO1766680.1 hypothetical protein [Allobranchiibius sp. GilTou38]